MIMEGGLGGGHRVFLHQVGVDLNQGEGLELPGGIVGL